MDKQHWAQQKLLKATVKGDKTKNKNDTIVSHTAIFLLDSLFWELGFSLLLSPCAYNSFFSKTLLDNGAKYIVVQGLPPIGCLPLGLFSSKLLGRDKWGCAAAVNSATMVYNQVLQMTLDIIRKKNPHCTIVYADYWNAFLEILTNPAKYHFEESFKTCCGGGGGEFNFHLNSLCGSKGTSTCNDASKYINWDGIHLTEAMHWQITDLFLNQGYCRPSFNELIKNKFGM